VLDIGDGVGALIISTRADVRGHEIEVSPVGDETRRTHTAVLERRVNGRSVFAALFLALPVGEYHIWTDDLNATQRVSIIEGEVTQVDWR
jgi:hypothetical protein